MSKAKSTTVLATDTKLAGSKTCTVGLKHPNGLILRLFRTEEVHENTPSGPRAFNQSFPVQDDNGMPVTVELQGYGGAAFGQQQKHRIEGQYALTHNVPTDFMREWMKQNQQHDLVRNNLIIVHADAEDSAAQGREQIGVWDGLNPLRMHSSKKDPRVGKKVRTLTKDANEDAQQETIDRGGAAAPTAAA